MSDGRTPEQDNRALAEATADFERELAGMVRAAEASPYHTEGSRETARVMRDAAVRAFKVHAAALSHTPDARSAELERMLAGLVEAVNTKELASAMAVHSITSFCNVEDALKPALAYLAAKDQRP